MNNIEIFFIIFGCLAIGFTIGYLLVYFVMLEPMIKMNHKVLNVLKSANITNRGLVDELKSKHNSNVDFKVMTVDEIPKEIKDRISNLFNDNNEKQFFIEQLTRIGAKGWTVDDSLEELTNLYNLLNGD